MKKLFFLTILFSFSLSFAQTTEPNGYQKAKWGMSMQKVKSLFDKEWEDPVEVEGDQTILFRDVIAGNPASFSFLFFEDKLYFVIVAIHPVDDTPLKIRLVFYHMVEMLRAKYGKPYNSELVFFPAEVGIDTWQFKDTRIDVGYMPNSHVQVRYYSKVLEKARNRKHLQKDKDKDKI